MSPPPRLATQMGISRTSLRTGLQTLVAEGLLLSKHGSGLFVASDLGKSIVDPLISLMDSSPNSMFDYLSFRRMIEGQSAAFVAENATEAEWPSSKPLEMWSQSKSRGALLSCCEVQSLKATRPRMAVLRARKTFWSSIRRLWMQSSVESRAWPKALLWSISITLSSSFSNQETPRRELRLSKRGPNGTPRIKRLRLDLWISMLLQVSLGRAHKRAWHYLTDSLKT